MHLIAIIEGNVNNIFEVGELPPQGKTHNTTHDYGH